MYYTILNIRNIVYAVKQFKEICSDKEIRKKYSDVIRDEDNQVISTTIFPKMTKFFVLYFFVKIPDYITTEKQENEFLDLYLSDINNSIIDRLLFGIIKMEYRIFESEDGEQKIFLIKFKPVINLVTYFELPTILLVIFFILKNI